MSTHRCLRYLMPAAALAAAACADGVGAGRTPLTLSFSTQTTAGATANLTPSANLISVSTGANTIVVTKAQMVLDEIELKASTTSCDAAASTADRDCSELRLDPVLVDLPIDAMTQLDLGALVPDGTYQALEFKMDAVESGEHPAAAAFLAAHPGFQNVAVRIEGTFNGEPFVFTSHEDAELELLFSPPVTVGAGSANVTIKLDVAAWFKDSLGNVVDPRDSNNASIIMNNIKRSFHAFEDHDRDGEDDHAGQG